MKKHREGSYAFSFIIHYNYMSSLNLSLNNETIKKFDLNTLPEVSLSYSSLFILPFDP